MLAALLLVTACHGDESEPETSRPTSPEAYAAALFEATNEIRAELDLPRLRRSRCLEAEAWPRAEALVGQPLDHRPLDDVTARCAPRGRVAENLVETSKPPVAVLDAWMNSPGHRNNLVDPGLNRMGIACVGKNSIVCVQLFWTGDRMDVADDAAPQLQHLVQVVPAHTNWRSGRDR